jgi:hypothetical protein
MLHSKGKLILRLTALVALLVGLAGISLPASTLAGDISGGTIVIVKVTDPAGGKDFQFTHNIVEVTAPHSFDLGDGQSFNLDHGQQKRFDDVLAGDYTVTETDPSVTPGGYTLTDVTCVESVVDHSPPPAHLGVKGPPSFPSSGNVGTRTATIGLDAGEIVTCTFTNEPDADGDGVPDSLEGTGDRDGDGVPDCEDYDPTGYFYDETTGQIIAGGQIAVTGPGAVVIAHDGSDGFYQFTTDGTAGTYTIGVTLPPGYAWSNTCLRQDPPPFDPTGGENPTVLGNGEDGDTGFLTSNACTDYYLTFDLAAGDPVIFNNNFPIGELFTLTVNVTGGGGGTGKETRNMAAGWSGRVTSDPAGINCGADCTNNYLENTVVTLTAHPGVKSYLASWSGDCSGTGLTAQVTMDADRTCTATFGYPVGGIVVPVDKLGLLAPWLGLAVLASLAALTVALVRRRRGG